MPERGDFELFSCSFKVPKRVHYDEFLLKFKVDSLNAELRRVVGAVRAEWNPGYSLSVELFKGTKDEVLDYLRSPKVLHDIIINGGYLDEYEYHTDPHDR